MKEVYRVLKDSGSMYVFSGWNNLKDILSGEKSINGIQIDEDKRWQIIIHLASKGQVDEMFIENELQKSYNNEK